MASDTFELWDFESRNLLGVYDSELEALKVVRMNLRAYGPDAVCHWGLGHDRRGRLTALATGDVLIKRALTTEPDQPGEERPLVREPAQLPKTSGVPTE